MKGAEIESDPSAGIIISTHSLVLQGVNRNTSGEYICQVIRRGRTFNDERAGIIERVNITMSGMYRYVLNIYKKRIKINAHNAYKLHDGVVHYLMFHDC